MSDPFTVWFHDLIEQFPPILYPKSVTDPYLVECHTTEPSRKEVLTTPAD